MTQPVAPETADGAVAVYRLDLQEARRLTSHPSGEDRAWIEPLLHENAVWFCRLRWIVVAVLGLAGVAGWFPELLRPLGLELSPGLPLGSAACLAALNLVFIRLIRHAGPSGRRVPVRVLLWGQIVTDLLVLTGVIHWLGQPLPAAPFMYLFHVILACIVLTPGESLAVAGLAATLYLLLLLVESQGVLPRTSVFVDPANPGSALTSAPPAMGVLSLLLIWSVIWYLVSRLASALRFRDRELFLSNRRLRASIEERSQHMLLTTHQLKAPFAAIHAQSQLLLDEYCGRLPDAARFTVEKISARCVVLARQIQEMLQLANLRSQGQLAPAPRRLNLGNVIEDVLARVEPAARQRGVRFEKKIDPVSVEAVEDHLTMMVDNLVVNAVNYSYRDGVVDVACHGHGPSHALLIVRDHGIGIPREKLPRIFDDYYRTEEAVQHNRASTGLGLAIVRQVACKDGVPITVESAPGWGTRFTVTLPSHAPTPSSRNNLN